MDHCHSTHFIVGIDYLTVEPVRGYWAPVCGYWAPVRGYLAPVGGYWEPGRGNWEPGRGSCRVVGPHSCAASDHTDMVGAGPYTRLASDHMDPEESCYYSLDRTQKTETQLKINVDVISANRKQCSNK